MHVYVYACVGSSNVPLYANVLVNVCLGLFS